MSWLAKLALRLYPKAWLERYRAELETLLDDTGESWRALPDLLLGAAVVRMSRFGWPHLVFPLLAGIAVIAFLSPTRAQSEAVLLLVSKPGRTDAAVEAQFSALKRELLSDGVLTEMARQLGTPVWALKDRDIRIRRLPSREADRLLFSISCESSGPGQSINAVKWMVNILMTGDALHRRRILPATVLEVVATPVAGTRRGLRLRAPF